MPRCRAVMRPYSVRWSVITENKKGEELLVQDGSGKARAHCIADFLNDSRTPHMEGMREVLKDWTDK